MTVQMTSRKSADRKRAFRLTAALIGISMALAACNQFRPDAMTLDLHMPGLDGLGVLRALKAGKATSVPVIVVSAAGWNMMLASTSSKMPARTMSAPNV